MAGSDKGWAGIGRGLGRVCLHPGSENLRRKPERESKVSIFLFNRLSVFLLKPFDPACGVHKFLFAGVEGMTTRTDFHTDLLLRAPCLQGRSTGAFDHHIIKLGVDILFHLHSLQIYLTDFVKIFNSFGESDCVY